MIALLLWASLLPAQADTVSPQRAVDYRIEARLDERTDVLTGRARMTYRNRASRSTDTLYLHQHLNAFRPNSAWARRELEYGERRFQQLGPEQHAYERLSRVEVDGRPVRPVYPGAPDSTVVALPLPAPLRPGGTVTVTMDWTARLSTLPRRQGREGRHYDWAQWYPRVAVFDSAGWHYQPLLPQGEFFGEFGSYDVTVEVAADQVVGATGVPVEGDPGWRVEGRLPAEEVLRRNAYPPRPEESLGLLTGSAPAGQKRIRWRAEDVHHFAWTHSPLYRYDGVQRFALDDDGQRRELPSIHVLYRDPAWQGTVARATYEAVDWLQGLFGPYPWPQLTVAHRLESGGTEFPMLNMNGSASVGLIVHEATHEYLHGILANNEWREGWLDEGFTSFVTNWFHEERGDTAVWRRTLASLAQLERSGRTAPIARPGAEFSNPAVYGAMTYTKTAAVFYMLREMLGEEAFRRGLRTYYEQNRLQHVTEADLRRAFEEASGRQLDWFFDQWLHTTATLDYGVGRATSTRVAGGWLTRVEVIRQGRARMPVELRVGDRTISLDSRAARQVTEVTTRERPDRVVLDPDWKLLDIDRENNARPVT